MENWEDWKTGRLWIKNELTRVIWMIGMITFWKMKKIENFLETGPFHDYHFQNLRYWCTRAKNKLSPLHALFPKVC